MADDKVFPQQTYNTPVMYQVPLTYPDCAQKLKEAHEEIERLRAEIARLQGEIDFLKDGGVATVMNRLIYGDTFGYHPPNLQGPSGGPNP